jgi:hypothetical protein
MSSCRHISRVVRSNGQLSYHLVTKSGSPIKSTKQTTLISEVPATAQIQ